MRFSGDMKKINCISYRVFGDKEKTIRALVSQMSQYYVRIDAFNENGITHGKCLPVKNKM